MRWSNCRCVVFNVSSSCFLLLSAGGLATGSGAQVQHADFLWVYCHARDQD